MFSFVYRCNTQFPVYTKLLGYEKQFINSLMCALDWYDRVPVTNILYDSLQEDWVTRKGTEVYTQKLRSSFHTFLQSHSHKGKGSRAREGHFLLQRVKA